jgi:hypothetical protein
MLSRGADTSNHQEPAREVLRRLVATLLHVESARQCDLWRRSKFSSFLFGCHKLIITDPLPLARKRIPPHQPSLAHWLAGHHGRRRDNLHPIPSFWQRGAVVCARGIASNAQSCCMISCSLAFVHMGHAMVTKSLGHVSQSSFLGL